MLVSYSGSIPRCAPRKVGPCNADDIVPKTAPFVRSQYHGMFRDAVDQDKVNLFPGSSEPYPYMGKVGVMVLVPVKKGDFNLTLALVPQPCCQNPLPMEKELPLGRKADDIILSQPVEPQEHLVVIVPPVHEEDGSSKLGASPFHGGKGHIVSGCESLSLEEWTLKKMLAGWPFFVRAQASATWQPFSWMFFVSVLLELSLTRPRASNLRPSGFTMSLSST